MNEKKIHGRVFRPNPTPCVYEKSLSYKMTVFYISLPRRVRLWLVVSLELDSMGSSKVELKAAADNKSRRKVSKDLGGCKGNVRQE